MFRCLSIQIAKKKKKMKFRIAIKYVCYYTHTYRILTKCSDNKMLDRVTRHNGIRYTDIGYNIRD